MARLRTVDGLTLRELGERFGITPERVRQLLRVYCNVRSVPETVKARKAAATARVRAEDLAAANARASDILARWRLGEDPKKIRRAFGITRRSTMQVIREAATPSDRAARVAALHNPASRVGI